LDAKNGPGFTGKGEFGLIYMAWKVQYLMGERLGLKVSRRIEFSRWRTSSSFWRVLILIFFRLEVEEMFGMRILSSVCTRFLLWGEAKGGIWVSLVNVSIMK
jgi:hypothetical protein